MDWDTEAPEDRGGISDCEGENRIDGTGSFETNSRRVYIWAVVFDTGPDGL